MDLAEFTRVLWRRKVIFVFTAMLIAGLAVGSLFVQTKVYQATSTVALLPSTEEAVKADSTFIISQVSVLAPLYAEAIVSNDTLQLARDTTGGPLADISVRVFDNSPVIKIDAKSSSPRLAQVSAQAATEAILERIRLGTIDIQFLVVSQIARPTLPSEPVSPQPKLTIAVAVVLGLGFGVGAALLRESLGRKVETAEALSAIAGAPVFGEIPPERSVPRLRSAADLVGDSRYRVVAEALRDLRTNMQFTEGGFRSVLVTSPEGRHGKTTVAFGLAATLARSGARTLLVDGDLRRGRVASMLGLEQAPGFMEVLKGTPVEEVAQSTDIEALQVLTGGELIGDPGELLESEFFSALYKLERTYDAVIIDGTPLVPINDARIMARFASCTLLVASAGEVTRRQLKVATDRLAIINVPLTAVVLNNSKVRQRASYYSYLNPVPDKK